MLTNDRKFLTLEISNEVAGLLATLDEEGDVEMVVQRLIDHAQQGVYRPGAWEREWIVQVFGYDFEKKLESGCPYGGVGHEHIFQKPKKP